MSDVTVTINSSKIADEISRMSEKMPGALQNALRKAALTVERAAKIKSPVDTGRMRSSIMTDIRPLIATVSPHVNYAIFVHQGTRHLKPRPFMREALDESEEIILDIFAEEVEKALQ